MIKRILLMIMCSILLYVSWSAVINMRDPVEKQAELIEMAKAEISNKTHVNAVPYLTDAAGYNTDLTVEALVDLKNVYIELGETQAYLNTLKQLTSLVNCPADIYDEFTDYYINKNNLVDALKLLKLGIENTTDSTLIDKYEKIRYKYTIGKEIYDDVTLYHNKGIQVKKDGFWGLANSSGKLIIPCEYEKISTYDTVNNGCVIVLRSDKSIAALNMKNHPTAIMGTKVTQLGNLSQNIIPLRIENGNWILADSKLISNYKEYENIGTVSGSSVAVKTDQKWGVARLGNDLIVPYEYDAIIMDEIGRCYAQDAVFVKKDGDVLLFKNGVSLTDIYSDAKPFGNEGYAAVKKDGKWGYIDVNGEIKIKYQFDDALSFEQNLAAVKNGEYWGYIDINGKIAIEPVFKGAKSFLEGHAPVLYDNGWRFITLIEYSKGAGI